MKAAAFVLVGGVRGRDGAGARAARRCARQDQEGGRQGRQREEELRRHPLHRQGRAPARRTGQPAACASASASCRTRSSPSTSRSSARWSRSRARGRPSTGQFIVLDTDGVNAYAAPGGFVHITRGLLGLIKNEAELAGVLGHEITHVTEKHTIRAIQKSKGMDIARRSWDEQRRLDHGTARQAGRQAVPTRLRRAVEPG